MTDPADDNAAGAKVKASAKKDPDGFTNEDFARPDWALELLLGMTIDLDPDNSISMSVISGGALVSGLAINRDRWRELFVAQIKEAGQEGSTDALAEAIGGVISTQLVAASQMTARRTEAGLPTPAIRFLHFKDARVHTGLSGSDFPLFRVRIEDVTGWSLGSHVPRE